MNWQHLHLCVALATHWRKRRCDRCSGMCGARLGLRHGRCGLADSWPPCAPPAEPPHAGAFAMRGAPLFTATPVSLALALDRDSRASTAESALSACDGPNAEVRPRHEEGCDRLRRECAGGRCPSLSPKILSHLLHWPLCALLCKHTSLSRPQSSASLPLFLSRTLHCFHSPAPSSLPAPVMHARKLCNSRRWL